MWGKGEEMLRLFCVVAAANKKKLGWIVEEVKAGKKMRGENGGS